VDLPERVRTVHADHWQAQGLLRARHGGAVQELRGIRVMFSGVQMPELNAGDVTDPDCDLEGARAFYDRHRVTDWAVRVPSGIPWSHGHKRRTLRVLGLEAGAHRPVPPAVPGLTLRAAVPHDVDAVLAVDAIAFGVDPGERGPFFAPMLASDAATVVIGELRGEPVATGYVVPTDGRAGPAAHLGGIAVLPAHRGRGIGAAVSEWLLEAAWASGARLAELHADSDLAARLYHRLGFFEAGGLDVYVGL
jgi:GNAT superfamily N-acetyltransferase